MLDNPFRAFLPKVTRPLISVYGYLGLSPNQVTMIGFLFGLLSALLITQKLFLIAAVFWWIGRLFDGTDGIYARAIQKSSHLGAHLDIFLDMGAYSAVILAFNFVYPEFANLWLVILALYILCITGALSLGSLMDKEKISPRDNRGLHLATGLAEGGETGLMYTLMLLLPVYIETLIYIWIFILIITVVARLVLAVRVLK